MDISMTGYIILFISIFIGLPFITGKVVKKFIKYFTFLLLLFFTFLSVVDVELYRNWGFRIDSTVLLYLKTPKESIESTPLLKVTFLLLIAAFIIAVFYILFLKFVITSLKSGEKLKVKFSPFFLLLAALSIIPIRGGLGLAPINQGTVYFSKHQFINHAAINPLWNFGWSLTKINKEKNIKFMPDKEAFKIFSGLLKSGNGKTTYLLNKKNVNVVIIILESFTANVIEPLGGTKGATPNLNTLSGQGVFFKNFYASGDRSDKGLIAVLSGYPAQPESSIIKFPNKTGKLPFLNKDFKKYGYNSSFYYGGDINFANMKSYFITGRYDKIISKKDFNQKDMGKKWGARDEAVFNKLFEDMKSEKQPFFKVMFTLSSHEPFDVPHKSKFSGSDEVSKFLNSIHYADSCIGDFFKKVKSTKLWNNTLFVLVADHGKRIPGYIPYNSPKAFHIPMIWLGGVIKKDTVITATASQNDIPVMIENQLDIKGSDYKFGKDILKGQKHFAFYAFNNGFGFYNDTSGYVRDNVSGKIVFKQNLNQQIEKEGKAFLQMLIKDFNSK